MKRKFLCVVGFEMLFVLLLVFGVRAQEPGEVQNAMSEKAPATTIYSQGQFVVYGTWDADLDSGEMTYETADVDFNWTIVDSVERYLLSRNEAKFFVLGPVDFDAIEPADLLNYPYSTAAINGSLNASNQIPSGTVLAAITNEGRYTKFRIDSYGYNLTISWVTYENVTPPPLYKLYIPLVFNAP
ncbi:MAG: hypothetical protein H6636_12095 [Anaerolineales bacterium]|nr:hypothetical protein [Anaerolineales bacterium]